MKKEEELLDLGGTHLRFISIVRPGRGTLNPNRGAAT